jgi:hypothetical protein
MQLNDMFSRGSRLKDVPPLFQGMPLKQWQGLKIAEQCSNYVLTQDPEKAPLNQKRIWTPRDDHGIVKK